MAGKRLIHKNVCTSEKINCLTPEAEVLYNRIMTNVDDYGHCHANPHTIKDICYPLKEDMTPDKIGSNLMELLNTGLVRSYHVHNVKYLEIDRFEDFQTFRVDRKRRQDCPFPIVFDEITTKTDVVGNTDTVGMSVDIPEAEVKVEVEVKAEVKEIGTLLLPDGSPSALKKADIDVVIPEVLREWNEIAVDNGLSKIIKLSDSRTKKLRLRLLEGLCIRDLGKHIKESAFLRGQNDRGWRIDFDWILENDKNYLKVMEGKYNNKKHDKSHDTHSKAKDFANKLENMGGIQNAVK